MTELIKLDEEGREKLKNAIGEMVNSFYRKQSESDLQKEITKRMKDELQIPPKLFKALSKIAYQDSAKKLNDEITEILDIAEEIGLYSHNPDTEQ